eukprot:716051-Prymnesium_polylepis.1
MKAPLGSAPTPSAVHCAGVNSSEAASASDSAGWCSSTPRAGRSLPASCQIWNERARGRRRWR